MWVTRDLDKPDVVFEPDCVYEEVNGRIYENRNKIHHWIDDAIGHRIVLAWGIANSLMPVGEKDGLPSRCSGHSWLMMLVRSPAISTVFPLWSSIVRTGLGGFVNSGPNDVVTTFTKASKAFGQ